MLLELLGARFGNRQLAPRRENGLPRCCAVVQATGGFLNSVSANFDCSGLSRPSTVLVVTHVNIPVLGRPPHILRQRFDAFQPCQSTREMFEAGQNSPKELNRQRLHLHCNNSNCSISRSRPARRYGSDRTRQKTATRHGNKPASCFCCEGGGEEFKEAACAGLAVAATIRGPRIPAGNGARTGQSNDPQGAARLLKVLGQRTYIVDRRGRPMLVPDYNDFSNGSRVPKRIVRQDQVAKGRIDYLAYLAFVEGALPRRTEAISYARSQISSERIRPNNSQSHSDTKENLGWPKNYPT